MCISYNTYSYTPIYLGLKQLKHLFCTHINMYTAVQK